MEELPRDIQRYILFWVKMIHNHIVVQHMDLHLSVPGFDNLCKQTASLGGGRCPLEGLPYWRFARRPPKLKQAVWVHLTTLRWLP